jgi:hypothetical protein
MTFPITPNPSIHVQPKDIGSQQMLFTGGQLQTWAQQLPLAMTKALVDSLLTTLGASQTDITIANESIDALSSTIQEWLTPTVANAQTAYNNWVTLLESLGLSAQTADALVSFLQTLLSPSSPLNASNLWGLLPPNVASNLPSTSVNSATVNQLWNPNFESAVALQPNAGWSWSSSVYYTAGSVGTPGSATVTANGSTFGLRGNPIPVSGGQAVALSVQLLTSGLVCTGSPIELDVVTYLNNTQVSVLQVQTSAAPSGANTTWTGAPSGSVAGSLSGTYTVPNDGSVNSVAVRLALDSTATAGQVWFGGASATLSGGLIATIQSDLSSLSSDFTAGNTAFATFLQSALADITGYTSWSTFIANLESQWNTYITTATSLTSAEFFTIQQLINTLLGISPTTGLMSATNVQSSTGAANLQADINAVFTPFTSVNGLTSTTAWQDSWTGLMNLLGIGTSNLSVPTPPTGLSVVGSSTGGTSLAAGTYYWVVTGIVSSAETGASNEVTATLTGSTSSAALTWTALPGATGYKVYRGTAHGGENIHVSSPATTSYTDTGSVIGSGSPPQPAAQVAPAQVSNVLGNGSLGADMTSLATQLFGSATVSNITTIENDIINFITNALSGGSAPTSSTSSPAAALASVLGPSGIPHVNVAIPPSPGSGSITHDANASATPYTTTTSLQDLTWNHHCGLTANYLVARTTIYSTSTIGVAATYNGVAMQILAQQVATDGATYNFLFGLPNPTTGSSKQVSLAVYAPFGAYIKIIGGESDSYIGVGSVGSTVTNSGTSSTPSITVPSATGDYIVQAFASTNSIGTYNQTTQYNSGAMSNGATSIYLVAGDAAGASSVSFTGTASPFAWAATAANLIPLPSTVLGSGFRAANTSTSGVSASSGNNTFPNSFFNTTVTSSTDLTYSASSGNTVTIAHAGWYTVTISVLLSALYYNQAVGLNLIQTPNGGSTITKRGHVSWIGTTANANIVCAFTFQVYCGAGDTLQPGYWTTASGTAFVGTSDGLSTYFEVSLNNRSLM